MAADFEKTYQEYQQMIYAFLLRLCGNAHLAEELTQETFFKAMRSMNTFTGRCRVDVWLCQIAKNAYYDHCRRQKKRGDAPEDTVSPVRVEDALMDREQAMQLHEKLHALDEPYKEVFMLRVFGELKYAQIASLFGRTESWARVTFYRAKIEIQKRMEEDEHE